MVFSSFVFVSMFFPLTYIINRLLPVRISNLFLLAASLFLYAWGEPVYVVLLIACAVLNYLLALLMEKHKKGALWLTLIVNIGVLCAYKYTGFIVQNVNALTGLALTVPAIRMPVGISFFTFQAMSYVLDVYRGECRPQKSFIN